MDNDRGSLNSKIWLIGDSAPKNWKSDLKYPFDERHPIIHNIWTPILYTIQKNYYLKHNRMISDEFYIVNAVEDASDKPKSSSKDWNSTIILHRMEVLKQKIDKYNPQIIITFGAFSYEFLRRTMKDFSIYPYNHWGAINLGNEFRNNIENSIIIPLLHRSVAGGYFLNSHNYFTGKQNSNYFEYVSELLLARIEKMIVKEI